MGWNDDDKKDPWRGGKGEPPDLEAMIKALHKKLKAFFPKTAKNPFASQPSVAPSKKAPIPGGSALFSMIGLGIFLLWVLSGIFIVDPAEQAVVLRFGKYVKTVGPGPHWIPRFISTKVVYNVDRVLDYSYSAQMLTQDENLVSVSLVVQYRIGDLKAFLFNVASPIESLQQATSSALRQVVGSTTLDQIITEGREAWAGNVRESLIAILNRYNTGIEIVNVSPQPARAPENVQEAFDDAIKAQEDEKRFKEQAYAYQARVVPIAEGNAKRIFEEAQAYAKQAILRAKGDVSEFQHLLSVYNQAPFVTAERMYIDTMESLLSRTSKMLVDGKQTNALYLPLEKWLKTTGSIEETGHRSSTVSMSSPDNMSNTLPEEDVTRPTYHFGGN